MRTADEYLRNGVTKSNLYFDNDGYRMVLVSEAEKAINESRKELLQECIGISHELTERQDAYFIETKLKELLDQIK